MVVDLYRCNSSRNTIGKKLTSVNHNVNFTLKTDTSVTSPVIEINSIDPSVNYAYIPKYNRYYYIDDIVYLTGKRCELHLHCDVLESFKNDILKMKCVINKQQTRGNKYFNDGSLPVLSTDTTQSINFPNGFDTSPSYVLIVAGGEAV